MNILSALLVREPTRMAALHELVPLEVSTTSRVAAVLAGVALLLLGRGLWRGKRTAWVLATLLLAGSLLFHLLKGLDLEEAIVSGLILAVLAVSHREFRAMSDPPTLRRALVALGAALLGALGYGTLGFFLLDRHFGARFDLGQSAWATISHFATTTGPEPVSGRGRWFIDSLDAIGLAAMAYGAWALLRPVVWRRTTGREEHERARRLVEQHGRNSLARFTLLPDKVYHFPAGLSGYVAFRPTGSVALALGDPIGPAEELPALLRAWLNLCERSDWVPALYQVLPDALEMYDAAGLKTLKIGEEAVLPLAEFTLEGSAWRKERNVVSRGGRDGLVLKLYDPPHTAPLLAELRGLSDEWLAARGAREKSFSLGAFDEAYLGESLVATVEETTGRIVAFVNLVGNYTRPGLAIDLMRHRADARNVMEFLVLSLGLALRGRGVPRLSLGLAPLSGLADSGDRAERAVHFLYEHLNRFYSFQGVRQFKEKFRPEWEPRYLVYPGVTDLPRIGVALARADSGEDLVSYFRKSRG